MTNSPKPASSVALATRAIPTQARTQAQPQVTPPADRRSPAYSALAGYRLALMLLDTGMAFLAGVVVLGAGPVRAVDFLVCLGFVALWAPIVAANRGYERGSVGAGNAEFSRVFRAFLHLTALSVFAIFALGQHPTRAVVVPALALILLLTCIGRVAARKVLHARRRGGRSLTPVIAVGDGDAVVEFTQMLRRDSFVGLDVVGACLVAPVPPGTATAAELRDLGVRQLGAVADVAVAARRFEAPTVAVVGGTIGAERLKRIAWELEGSRADLVVSPGLAELGGRRMHIRPVAGLPLLHVEEPSFTGARRVVKRAFDIVAAGLALVLLSPLLLLTGLLVRATSAGPALFRQTRVGRNGREFTMIKFRSMCVDAEARLTELAHDDDGNGVLFKLHADPRVTPVGRVLRRLSLDELPQLINVLTGSMSLVGPRPPLPSEVARYHDDAHRRLLVKPGLTGLWQVSGRSNLSWEESIRLDLRYVEDWSLSLDLIVLWKTARAVLKAEGAY